VLETVLNFFQEEIPFMATIRVSDLIDIAILAFLIYHIFWFMRKTSSGRVLKGIMVLILTMWLASAIQLTATSWLLNRVVEWGILVLVILFQPEIRRVLERPEHAAVRARTSLITYGRDDAVTADYCARCDARIVWGGDATVAAVRAMPMPPHAVELCFPDRWSLAVFSQRAFSALTPEERGALAHRFYNDTYQMDQNACSSPQLVLWLEDGGDPACRGRWWEAVAAEAAERYPFGPFQAARKLERLCLCAMTMEEPAVVAVERYQGNLLYVAQLAGLSGNLPSLAGGFGLFFEADLPSLEALAPLLPPKAQTLVCGGLEPAEVAALLARAGARGVDRVVPLGQALEMDTVWDGRDLIAALSRIIG